MTLDDFYTALAACVEQFTWHDWGGDIRGHLRIDPNRARIEYCPLTAVASVHAGMPFSVSEPLMAAAEIGMVPDDAEKVIFAADGSSLGDYPATRARLRACVGLPPEEDHHANS